MRIQGRHYRTERPIAIECENGRIVGVEDCNGTVACDAPFIAPPFFDLQINGCLGKGFSSTEATLSDVEMIVAKCRRHGVAEFFPTLITNSFEALRHGMATIATARSESPRLARAMPGIHLEGPYLSAEDGPRGAHPIHHIRPPDWNEFQNLQDVSGGLIRLLTLAPEQAGAIPFIERVVESGVLVAIGHTAANRQQLRDAVNAGARLSTHLGNGSHAILPRHDNYIWQQMAMDDLWASVITDGHHLPPDVVQNIVRAKTPERIVVTCDASNLAGLPPGRYREWEQDFEILDNGKVTVAGTPYLGGSGDFTDKCVANMVSFAGVPHADAMDMAGARPRELCGLTPRTLAIGEPAEFILYDIDENNGIRFHKCGKEGNIIVDSAAAPSE